MGGKGSGRKPNMLNRFTPNKTAVASQGGEAFDLPNYSGVKYDVKTLDGFDSRYAQLAGNNTFIGTNEFNDDVTTNAELKGSKTLLGTFGLSSSTSTDAYLKGADGVQHSASIGYVLARTGSITNITILFNVNSVTFSAAWNFIVQINGSGVFNKFISFNSTGIKTGRAAQARNTDTFSGGDLLTVYADSTAGVSTISGIQVQVWGYLDS